MKFLFRVAMAFSVALAWSCHLAAEEPTGDLFVFGQDVGWYRLLGENTFSIVVDDQISDRCWTNIEATTNAVKVQLIRSGYEITEDTESYVPVVQLQASGYQGWGGQCIAAIMLSLWIDDFGSYHSTEDGVDASIVSIYKRRIWLSSYIMSGPKDSSNQRIKEAFVERAQKMLVDISSRSRAAKKAISDLPGSAARDYWIERLKAF